MAEDPITNMVQDPDFAKASPQVQRQALTAHDPLFANVDDNTLAQFIQSHQPRPSPQPVKDNSSVLGSGIKRVGDLGTAALKTLDPRQSGSAMAHGDIGTAIANTPIYRLAHGAVQGIDQASQQAVKYYDQAKENPDPVGKTLQYARSGIAGLSAFDPLATGSVTNVNQLEDQGQNRAALGQGLTDAAFLSLGTKPALNALGKAKAMIPSAARAGEALQEVKSAAGSIPIDMTKPAQSALDIWTDSQHGGRLPPQVSKFIKRALRTDGPEGPITYSEAKDFQSNISRLSADEYGRMTPNTRRLVGQLNADLKESLAGAADQVGMGTKFTGGMKEYYQAMKLKGYSDAAIANAWKAAIAGAGLYGAKKVLGLDNLPFLPRTQ